MGSRVHKRKLISVAEFAENVGLSRSYIYRLGRIGAIGIKDGLVDPVAAGKVIEGLSTTGGKESFSQARTRKEAALASLRELELRIKQGEYIPRRMRPSGSGARRSPDADPVCWRFRRGRPLFLRVRVSRRSIRS